jgi:hypothetical protein
LSLLLRRQAQQQGASYWGLQREQTQVDQLVVLVRDGASEMGWKMPHSHPSPVLAQDRAQCAALTPAKLAAAA